jgi:hypothetical protein
MLGVAWRSVLCAPDGSVNVKLSAVLAHWEGRKPRDVALLSSLFSL